MENIVVGNWLGDVSRGKDYLQYDKEIAKGILLHREIDTYTDKNELVSKATALLHESQAKYAPVVVDLFFDYFLIQNWEQFSDESYAIFKERNYRILSKHDHIYPENLKKRTKALLRYDWFEMYKTIHGLSEVLSQISVRTQFPNNMANATKELKKHQQEFNEIFLAFFPKLNTFCKQYLE